MNTISLVLNGRTAADLAMLPEKQHASITMITGQRPLSSLLSSSPFVSGSGRRRSRTRSRGSPGWYNTEGSMTLDDFARRLNTTAKRIERWQGICAHNAVMALLRPTPLLVFVCHPITLVILAIIASLWWGSSGDAGASR